jgi:hypothetical protein
MYQLLMAVIVIATLAAVSLLGINYMTPSSFLRVKDAEIIQAEHLRASLAIQAYRNANGVLPDETSWQEQIEPWLDRPLVELPAGVTWLYIRYGMEFGLCARQSGDALPSNGVSVISCDQLPSRLQPSPLVVLGTPEGTSLAPSDPVAEGITVDIRSWRIEIGNMQTVSIEVLDVRLENGTNFRIDQTDCVGVIAPEGTCTIDLVFFASGNGSYPETVLVIIADPG